MRLIHKIETNYFRSLYNETVKGVSDCNVFVGANDCGKSNFLRALNLFFNNETGYDEDLNFSQDVTHFRRAEAIATKGRLTIWMKVHFENTLGWGTLPRRFWIKKVWNRYSDFPEITTNIKSNNSTITTRFLNKISFHYVPAVKERDIFTDYLSLLYATLVESQNVEFEEPAAKLSDAINEATVQLADGIETNLRVKSRINIPADFQSIFEKLEFSTQQDGVEVPLVNRGDGLQVRHIPQILDYVSEHNKQLNIWGYEEPENSLEMSNCFSLAEQFRTQFSKNNQVFITSHSPAFYSLKGDNVSHYLVKKVSKSRAGEANEVTDIKSISDMSVFDSEVGVAQLIMEKSAAAYEEIKILKETNDNLIQYEKPILLTEGITDKIILEEAWRRLRGNIVMPFTIEACDTVADGNFTAGGAAKLALCLKAVRPSQPGVIVGLFDFDEEGIKHSVLDKTFYPDGLLSHTKISHNKKAASMVVAGCPALHSALIEFENLPLEFLFPEACIKKKLKGRGLVLSPKPIITRVGRKEIETTYSTELQHMSLDKKSDKKLFAERIAPTFDDEAFLGFEPTLVGIQNLFEKLS